MVRSLSSDQITKTKSLLSPGGRRKAPAPTLECGTLKNILSVVSRCFIFLPDSYISSYVVIFLSPRVGINKTKNFLKHLIVSATGQGDNLVKKSDKETTLLKK